MIDYIKMLPQHVEKVIGMNDLFLEVFEGEDCSEDEVHRPPLLFIHGAFTGSWMWSKYIPHFTSNGWKCYSMNLRSHYKSRVMDMTKISFEDYLEDIKLVIEQIYSDCGMKPIVIGFSLGGILSQKIAETEEPKGLVLIDSSISKEVNEIAPYDSPVENNLGIIMPAPVRDENFSLDESEDDIIFQRKYLSMESSKAMVACGCWIRGVSGVSINSKLITCPTLVIKSVNSEEEDRRGNAEAVHLNATYAAIWNSTHTGLLVGQRYMESVEPILDWLKTL